MKSTDLLAQLSTTDFTAEVQESKWIKRF